MTTNKAGYMAKGRDLNKRVLTRAVALVLTLLFISALVSGCGGKPAGGGPPRDNTPEVLVPQAPGEATAGESGLIVIDYSNVSNGYFVVQYAGENPTVKLLVTRGDMPQYSFFLPIMAVNVIPLTYGDGTYKINVYENIDTNGIGDQYHEIFNMSFDVAISDEYLPFLYPNQYVNFNAESAAVAQGAKIVEGASSELEAIEMVFDYMIDNIKYDYDFAAAGPPVDYLPDIDTTLATGKGICFDFAALMTAILRSQRLPTQLVTGYAGSIPHAWIGVHSRETGKIININFDGEQWKKMDPTLAATAGGAADFVGDGSDYQELYRY